MSTAQKNNKNNKGSVITLSILVAAAVVSTAVTAHALGGFGDAFSDFFTEESPNGLYSGEDLTIQSDNTNVEFIGMSGNNTTVDSAINLTRKNGQPFIDSSMLGEGAWISPAFPNDENSEYLWFIGKNYDQVIFDSPTRGNSRYEFGVPYDESNRWDVYSNIEMYFEDTSTIGVSIFTTAYDGGIKGSTMTVELNNLSFYTVDEIIYDYSEHYGDNDPSSYYDIPEDDYYQTVSQLREKYGTAEHDGRRLITNPLTQDIVLAYEHPLDIDVLLSVKMSYKSTTERLKAKNLNQCVQEWGSSTTGTFTPSPFSIYLNVKADIPGLQDIWNIGTTDNASRMKQFVDFMHRDRPAAPKTITVTLADGSAVTGIDQGWGDDNLDERNYSIRGTPPFYAQIVQLQKIIKL